MSLFRGKGSYPQYFNHFFKKPIKKLQKFSFTEKRSQNPCCSCNLEKVNSRKIYEASGVSRSKVYNDLKDQE
ncbi:predicted protein [Methanosarcina acetivorans C2A]|uniref:Uncharacterized protein n=1 Tax=Methanosarcina acetivorans (strain ATCC 35395 / DSM 2834 / JCM 12185 / C2A) TaxID=188937 RepID=Q8TLS3_METAC|nr:predicted protein [Methanosarcina acetivorans C2A]